MEHGEPRIAKWKYYAVRTPIELEEGIKVHMAQWLAERPRHSANNWWCEAARLMLRQAGVSPRTTANRPEPPRTIVRHEEPQPGEIIEREVYDGEVEVPEMSKELTPARMPALRSDGRVIPTKESRLKPQPVIAPQRVE